MNPMEQMFYNDIKKLYTDPESGSCIKSKPGINEHIIFKTMDQNLAIPGYYSSNCLFIANMLPSECDFCIKEKCLFYKPEIQIVNDKSDTGVIIKKEK